MNILRCWNIQVYNKVVDHGSRLDMYKLEHH